MTAGQWGLMWQKFRRNRLALASGAVLLFIYFLVIFAGFVAPYDPDRRFVGSDYLQPRRVHFRSEEGFSLRPFTYGVTLRIDEETGRRIYETDKSVRWPIHFFVQGDEYSLFGVKLRTRLFGLKEDVADQGIFLLGTDRQGRDMFSRMLYGGRISMTVGMVGVLLSMFIGTVLGVTAGYFGGLTDHLLQRTIEILRAFPQIPLWMALSAAIPADVDQVMNYFLITLILSVLGWTGLARQLRGQVLALRSEEFVLSARLMGASHSRIIFRHLIPAVWGHVIVIATIAIPGMILGESSLSFLGLGIRPPMVSWGALLQDAQSLMTLVYYQWLLAPAVMIVVVVFCFNFLGDGLRDAADPYSVKR
ncbi:MAG TPA: ABC transporter permease [Sedimentisphaerales bacterium]|nr:ABC transporter permease [Sedimentisphaerales bacterium]